MNVDETHSMVSMYSPVTEATYIFTRWSDSINIMAGGIEINIAETDVEEFVKTLRQALRLSEPG